MFYTYSQINSGGNFGQPALHVIVEASSYKEANELIQNLTHLYFGENESGICWCCSDLWNPHWDDKEATEEPTIYYEPVALQAKKDELGGVLYDPDKVLFAVVYYKDGKVEFYSGKDKK